MDYFKRESFIGISPDKYTSVDWVYHELGEPEMGEGPAR